MEFTPVCMDGTRTSNAAWKTDTDGDRRTGDISVVGLLLSSSVTAELRANKTFGMSSEMCMASAHSVNGLSKPHRGHLCQPRFLC